MHVDDMNINDQPGPHATEAAEQILRQIYGDDFKGCQVNLESVAAHIDKAIQAEALSTREMVQSFLSLIEAIQQLSTPPSSGSIQDAGQLQSLLGERLDAIRLITTKAKETFQLYFPKQPQE